jgi:enoyl-CoA hydratase
VIHTSEQDGVTILRIDHGKVNELDVEVLDDLTDRLTEVEDTATPALVLTGTRSAFSAGADLIRVLREDRAYAARGVKSLDRAFTKLFTFPRPVVAAVNGHAIAGGCVLVCACDYRLMSEGLIGLAELRVGVPFPTAALEIVRTRVGPQGLAELVYFGDVYSPEDARARGLIDDIVETDQLIPAAVAIAQRLASIPASTFLHTKRALRRDAMERIERYRSDADREATDIWTSDEVHTSIRAFLDSLAGRRR